MHRINRNHMIQIRQTILYGHSQRGLLLHRCACTVVFTFTMMHATAGRAGEVDPEVNFLTEEDYVTIASGFQTPIARAPAVATVITSRQIEETGATDLDDALRQVPGLYVARSSFLYNPIYVIRGIRSQYNSQILVQTNSLPMTSYFAGDRGNIFGGLPLANVSRIEVIRGPGSALHGADAFAGVVNIVTKSPDEIGGTKLGVRRGSFGTSDAYILHGDSYGKFAVEAYLQGGKTNGDSQTIESDAQSMADSLAGTTASLAPGSLNLRKNTFDGALDISTGNWRLRTAIKQRANLGFGPGGLNPSILQELTIVAV